MKTKSNLLKVLGTYEKKHKMSSFCSNKKALRQFACEFALSVANDSKLQNEIYFELEPKAI